MPGQLVIGWTSPRRTEGAAWCGSQTRALPFPILPILPAPLAPLVATSLALLCAAGLVRRCGCGAKGTESPLGDSDHLFCAGSGGRLGCGGTFSFLILVVGGQIDVGVHVDCTLIVLAGATSLDFVGRKNACCLPFSSSFLALICPSQVTLVTLFYLRLVSHTHFAHAYALVSCASSSIS